MDTPGLSELEIRQIVERVFLPDICRFQVIDHRYVNLEIVCQSDPSQVVIREGVPREQLTHMRQLATMVQEVRALFDRSAGHARTYYQKA